MKEPFILIAHLITTLVRLARPGGVRSVVAESLVLLFIVKETRRSLQSRLNGTHRGSIPRPRPQCWWLYFDAFDWIGVAPFVPIVALLLWGRNIASQMWFFVVAFAASVGVHHVWTTAVVLLEYLRHGTLQAHPRNALWQFLRYDAQLYVVPLIALLVVLIIAKHWNRHAANAV